MIIKITKTLYIFEAQNTLFLFIHKVKTVRFADK